MKNSPNCLSGKKALDDELQKLRLEFAEAKNRTPREQTTTTIRMPQLATTSSPSDFERFRAKARQFLKANENHITMYKLRMNEPMTSTDLAELERMIAESGVGNADDVQQAIDASEGLGLFVRSLIGLDREAAKTAISSFLAGKTLRANQIEFLNLIVDHLTEHGIMDARSLYDSPYTDFSPKGVDGVFESKEVDELVSILDDVRKRAVA